MPRSEEWVSGLPKIQAPGQAATGQLTVVTSQPLLVNWSHFVASPPSTVGSAPLLVVCRQIIEFFCIPVLLQVCALPSGEGKQPQTPGCCGEQTWFMSLAGLLCLSHAALFRSPHPLSSGLLDKVQCIELASHPIPLGRFAASGCPPDTCQCTWAGGWVRGQENC